MDIEITVIMALISCVVGFSTFIIGRQTAAKNSGQEWGELKADIKYIKDDVIEVKAQVKIINNQYSDMHTDIVIVKRDLATAFNKIDDLRAK